jgi:predicted nuclease with TOPRIM domain
MVADSLLAAWEHHLPLSTATRQELTDLSREKEEMKAELGKLRGELNLFRSEAERVKREKHQCRDTYGRARATLRQLKLELDPGELPPHLQGDDDSDSSFACLFGRVVDRLELVPPAL